VDPRLLAAATRERGSNKIVVKDGLFARVPSIEDDVVWCQITEIR
jgi:hypothetical protein